MAKNVKHSTNQNPRWWMACNYDALRKSDDGLAWKLTGQGVKTETEEDLIGNDGSVSGAARSDKTAQQWANRMTENYPSLAREMPIFAELRNAIDLAVVATLISQERLDKKAGIDLSLLNQTNEVLKPVVYRTPSAVEPQCSFIRGSRGWVVTASGGVDINGFEVVAKQELDSTLADTKTSALASSDKAAWWWDKR